MAWQQHVAASVAWQHGGAGVTHVAKSGGGVA